MDAFSSRLRVTVLLAAGALAVHQLRYLAVYGSESKDALAVQGHAYLSPAVPAVIVLLVLAIASFAARLATAGPRRDSRADVPRIGRVWAGASALLLLVHGAQEWLEGVFEHGHPAGLGGVLGHGGALAIALAIVVGGLIAVLLRGAEAAIRHADGVPPRLRPRPPRVTGPTVALARRVPVDPLAGHLAGRGPPLASA